VGAFDIMALGKTRIVVYRVQDNSLLTFAVSTSLLSKPPPHLIIGFIVDLMYAFEAVMSIFFRFN
jgi:hypothetical protein